MKLTTHTGRKVNKPKPTPPVREFNWSGITLLCIDTRVKPVSRTKKYNRNNDAVTIKPHKPNKYNANNKRLVTINDQLIRKAY